MGTHIFYVSNLHQSIDDKMYIFDCRSIGQNDLSVFFLPFCIYYHPIIRLPEGTHIFYVSNNHCLIDNQMDVLDNWSIKQTNLTILVHPYLINSISIFKKLTSNIFSKDFFELIDHSTFQFIFITLLIRIYSGVLFFIKTLEIVVFFVRVDWISVLSWNLFSGVLENYMWDVSKTYMRIFYPHRLD